MKPKRSAPLFTGTPCQNPVAVRPARGRPTKEQSGLRNRELLDRSLDLFLERGFDGTTIEAIVESLGMGRRTVYSRYGDKITLFKAALQLAIDELVVPASRLHALEVDSLEETLLSIARVVLRSMLSPAGVRLTRIANAEVFQKPEIAAYLFENTANVTITHLTDLFVRRALAETAADAAQAFFLLVVQGSAHSRIWFSVSEKEFNRQLVYRTRLFLAGLEKATVPE